MPFKCCRGDWNRKTGATCNGLSRTQPPLHHDFAYPKVHPNRRQGDPAHSTRHISWNDWCLATFTFVLKHILHVILKHSWSEIALLQHTWHVLQTSHYASTQAHHAANTSTIASLICRSKARPVLLCPSDHSSQIVDWQKHESASPSNMRQIPYGAMKIQPSNSWRHRLILDVTACLFTNASFNASGFVPEMPNLLFLVFAIFPSVRCASAHAPRPNLILPHRSDDAPPNLDSCASHFPQRSVSPAQTVHVNRWGSSDVHERHTQRSNLNTRHRRLSFQKLQAKCHAIHHKPKRPFFISVELNCTNTLVTCGAVNSKITSKCSHSQSKSLQLHSPPRQNRTRNPLPPNIIFWHLAIPPVRHGVRHHAHLPQPFLFHATHAGKRLTCPAHVVNVVGFLVANGQSKSQSKPMVLDSNTTSNTAWTALRHCREKMARECSMPHWQSASHWEIWCPSRQIAKRTSHGNMKTTKLLSDIETKKVFNLGADTSTVEWWNPSCGGALASATCDHVWKGPRPSDRKRSSRAWTLRAVWWATPGSCPAARWTRSPTIRLGPPGLQSEDELGEEKQRRACTKHARWCWQARGVASKRRFSCNKINTIVNHEGPDFEQQVWSDVGPLGALVPQVEKHDAKGGLTIMRRMVKPKTDPRCTRVPSLRKSCHKPQSLCPSRCPLRKCFLFHKTVQCWTSPNLAREQKSRISPLLAAPPCAMVQQKATWRCRVCCDLVPMFSKRSTSPRNSSHCCLYKVDDAMVYRHLTIVRQKLGAGRNVSMDGKTDRSFLACIRRERCLRHHATEQKRQQTHGRLLVRSDFRSERWPKRWSARSVPVHVTSS